MSNSKTFLKTNMNAPADSNRSNPSYQSLRLKSIITSDKIKEETDKDDDNVKTIYNNSSTASKTILITNNIQPKSNSKAAYNSDNSSSITILTSHDNDD